MGRKEEEGGEVGQVKEWEYRGPGWARGSLAEGSADDSQAENCWASEESLEEAEGSKIPLPKK